MRKLAIMAALASTALATPAVARDNSWYVGVEGGAMIVEDTKLDFDIDDGEFVLDTNDGVIVDYNTGFDLDLIGGYDFGGFRIEGELGWKRASLGDVTFAGPIVGSTSDLTVESSGHASVLSAMVNGMLDFGDDDGWNGYVGGGGGFAKVKYHLDTPDVIDGDVSDSDTAFSWQVIAGVRKAITQNIDLGIKYRFFNTTTLNFGDHNNGGELSGRWRSHSLLASLIYNFYTPPPPPPPPPPPVEAGAGAVAPCWTGACGT